MKTLTINPFATSFNFQIRLDMQVLEELASWDFSNVYYDTAIACGIEYDNGAKRVQEDYCIEIQFSGSPDNMQAAWYLYSYGTNESTHMGSVDSPKEELESLLALIAERPSAYSNDNDYSQNAEGEYVQALIEAEVDEIDARIAIVSAVLIEKMQEKKPVQPYTCYVTRWDDGTFGVVVSSIAFSVPQHEAVKLQQYKKYVSEFRYYRGNISYIEKEEVVKNSKYGRK